MIEMNWTEYEYEDFKASEASFKASEASLENRSNQFSSSTEAKGLAHNPVVSPKRILNLNAGGVKP